MKKLLALLVLSLFFCSKGLLAKTLVKLPKDTSSGFKKVHKSLTGKYYKGYGMQVVDKKDGHPVRSGDKSIRFEVRSGDCGSDPCLLYTSPSPRDKRQSRMPSSA